MLASKWRFEAAGRRFRVEAHYGFEATRLRLFEGKALLAEQAIPSGGPDALDPHAIAIDLPEGRLEAVVGSIGWWTMACQARLNGEIVFRSRKQEFKAPEALRKMLAENAAATEEERKARIARAKARMPSVYVDVAMGFLFFIIARQTPDWQAFGMTFTGLQTAAVVGAAIAIALGLLQRIVKVDLLGGFAVFGIAMALLSAGLSIAVQDDLFVKLRGTLIGLIAATCFLADGLAGGRYLGVRMAGYLEQMMRIRPQRASFAIAGAGASLALIDLAAALALPKDAWLIYNTFLDGFVAMPITLAAIWIARERPPAKETNEPGLPK